jgi:fructose-1,6-bisphosphatase/inositol monophosphatase family enzyme
MAGGLHIRLAPDGVRETLARNARAVGSNFEPRGAGVEYLCLAQGQIDFTLFHRVLPWDHAAGVLLCREAGAFAGRLSDGALYRAGDDPWFGSLLVAPDEAAWRELRTALLG